jgi:hypothetical protein
MVFCVWWPCGVIRLTTSACTDSGVKSYKDVSLIGLQPKVSSAPVDSDGFTIGP